MEVSAVAGRHTLVREKASLIIELLDDDSRLRFERKKAKELNLDAIHDTVHEMAKDEARHGRGMQGLLDRYFK